MSSVVASSRDEWARVKSLLSKETPLYRRAYSDRTAWLMALLSELAYIKFNEFLSAPRQERFLETVSNLIDENRKSSLLRLVEMVGYNHEIEKERLIEELSRLDAELVETFDSDGTQAMLVRTEEFFALVFRGTEATSVKDIKTDARARMIQCETGGYVHEGFDLAFKNIEIAVQETLDGVGCVDRPLFLAGHSLGGALATVAAKKLRYRGGIAACYTYGSPRVGDDEWIADVKTPVYRLVNSADAVTMLPPSTTVVVCACWLVQKMPYVGEPIRNWLARFGGYLHCGNMRYLTNCVSGQYENVKLLYSVSLFYRLKGFWINQLPWRKFLVFV